MAGTIIADFIRTDANKLSLNVGNTTFATINASGLLSNTGATIIAANGQIAMSAITSSFDLTGKTLTLPTGNYKLINTGRFNTGGLSNTTSAVTMDLGTYTPASSSSLIMYWSSTRTWYTNNQQFNYHHYNQTRFYQDGAYVHSSDSNPYQGGGTYNPGYYKGLSQQYGTFTNTSGSAMTVRTTITSDSGAQLNWDASLVFIMEFAR